MGSVTEVNVIFRSLCDSTYAKIKFQVNAINLCFHVFYVTPCNYGVLCLPRGDFMVQNIIYQPTVSDMALNIQVSSFLCIEI